MKKLFLALGVVSFLLFACNSHRNDKTIQFSGTMKNDSIYIVDLDIEEESAPILSSSIFDKVETIILETRKEALVAQHFEFMAFDNYFFILNDQDPKDFLIFDRKGKFIRKIGGIGQGPGEYVRVFDFTIDPDNKIIFLNCELVINKYYMDGTFIGSIDKAENSMQIQFHNEKLYLEGRGAYLIIEVDPETGKKTGQYLDTHLYNKGFIEPRFSYGGNPFKHRFTESPRFAHSFMDTIMAIQPNGIMPFLAITSKYLTTNADIDATKGLEPNERIERIKNKNKIFCINFYFETKNHISFSYMQGKNLNTLVYDLATRTCKKGSLRNDLVFNGKIHMPSILYSDSNGVYESFHKGLALEFIYRQIQSGSLAPNLDKREELMKLPEDTNPVIFYYSYN